jgi:hypothetical protein
LKASYRRREERRGRLSDAIFWSSRAFEKGENGQLLSTVAVYRMTAQGAKVYAAITSPEARECLGELTASSKSRRGFGAAAPSWPVAGFV